MATKCISYSITLYANYYIESDTDEEAMGYANELLENDRFRGNHIIPDMDDPFQWGDALGCAKVEVLHDFDSDGDEPQFTRKDMDEIIGR